MCVIKSQRKEYIDIVVGDLSYKISMYCPHRWGRLQYGIINVKNKTITCPLHASIFSLETGAQISGPACGSIYVDLIGKEHAS